MSNASKSVVSTPKYDMVVRLGSATYAMKDGKLVWYENAHILDLINMDAVLGVLYVKEISTYHSTSHDDRIIYYYIPNSDKKWVYAVGEFELEPYMVNLILCSPCDTAIKIALLKKLNYDTVPFNDSTHYWYDGSGDIYSISEQRVVHFPMNDIDTMSDAALRKAISYGCKDLLDAINPELFNNLYSGRDFDIPLTVNIPGRLFNPSNPVHMQYAYKFTGLNQEQQKAVYQSNYKLSFDGGMLCHRIRYLAKNDLNVFLGDDYSVFADMPPINARSFVDEIIKLRGKDAFWSIARYIHADMRLAIAKVLE